jgi:hypothetical protein
VCVSLCVCVCVCSLGFVCAVLRSPPCRDDADPGSGEKRVDRHACRPSLAAGHAETAEGKESARQRREARRRHPAREDALPGGAGAVRTSSLSSTPLRKYSPLFQTDTMSVSNPGCHTSPLGVEGG